MKNKQNELENTIGDMDGEIVRLKEFQQANLELAAREMASLEEEFIAKWADRDIKDNEKEEGLKEFLKEQELMVQDIAEAERLETEYKAEILRLREDNEALVEEIKNMKDKVDLLEKERNEVLREVEIQASEEQEVVEELRKRIEELEASKIRGSISC
jgi:hypothetical protein